MELGEKLRTARLEAGLSQRQLCEGIVTRNMLSQIEHGSAKPSMDTLVALAARLGKSPGFFLEEKGADPNGQLLRDAWMAWEQGEVERTEESLRAFQLPDTLLEREYSALLCQVRLAQGEKALAAGERSLAGVYLAQAREAEEKTGCPECLRTRRLLLQGKLDPAAWQALPNVDELLLAKAECAMLAGETERCRKLLEAIEGSTSRSFLLLGKCALAAAQWQEAAEYLHRAEAAWPKETTPLLEQAYRELGDYRRAYEYACAQRKG